MKLGPLPKHPWPVFAELAVPRQVHCEICGRLQHQVQHMVAGPPGISVCSDCVVEIVELIARESPEWCDEVIDRLKRARKPGP